MIYSFRRLWTVSLPAEQDHGEGEVVVVARGAAKERVEVTLVKLVDVFLNKSGRRYQLWLFEDAQGGNSYQKPASGAAERAPVE